MATVAADGLLVVKREVPFSPTRECIVVPRQVLDGLLTALHIQLAHPTCHQLKAVVKRYLYALDMDKAIERVSKCCHPCAALRRSPKARVEQSTSSPPEAVGVSFAADVLKRSRQTILVLRETVTSFTSTLLLSDERHETLRDALVQLCIHLRPMDGPMAVIRTDPAPGFKALVKDELLQRHRIVLELGQAKNPDKNPVAERAIQELSDELLRLDPLGGAVSPMALSVATATLNSRIRSRGLSAREMWTQRDQFSNAQMSLRDAELIATQHQQRLTNHPHSERSKAPHARRRPDPALCVGDMVYIHADRNKSKARERYLVVSLDPPFCNIRKFTGSQLRSASYRMRMSDCFKVPSEVTGGTCAPDRSPSGCSDNEEHCSQDEEHSPGDTDIPPTLFLPPVLPPSPPAIPAVISMPACSDSPTAVPCLPARPSDPPGVDLGSTGEPAAGHDPPPLFDPVPPPCGELRRSVRRRLPPGRLRDYVTDF